MTQTTYSLMTVTGKNKEAAALANGTPLKVTHLAFGDGDYAPTGGETQLRNELLRKPVVAHGTVDGADNVAYFDGLLDANEGPFTIRECGVFDEGSMIAIIKYDPPIPKPHPASGQVLSATVRAHVAFSDLENLVLQIETVNAFIPAARRIDTGTMMGGGGDLSQNRTHGFVMTNANVMQAAEIEDNDGVAIHDLSDHEAKITTVDSFRKALIGQGTGYLAGNGSGGLEWVVPSYAAKSVTLSAGEGLAGLGDLSENRTVSLAFHTLDAAAPALTDVVALHNGVNHVKASLAEIAVLMRSSKAHSFFMNNL